MPIEGVFPNFQKHLLASQDLKSLTHKLEQETIHFERSIFLMALDILMLAQEWAILIFSDPQSISYIEEWEEEIINWENYFETLVYPYQSYESLINDSNLIDYYKIRKKQLADRIQQILKQIRNQLEYYKCFTTEKLLINGPLESTDNWNLLVKWGSSADLEFFDNSGQSI